MKLKLNFDGSGLFFSFSGVISVTLGCLLLLLFISLGCSAGFRSSLLEVEGRISSPRLGLGRDLPATVPVVYPATSMPGTQQAMAGVGAGGGLAGSYGPAWQGLEPVYKDYRFNPFNP